MHLEPESQDLNDYLRPFPPVIDWSSKEVATLIAKIQNEQPHPLERARAAFLFARDEISHSFDTKLPKVSITALDALQNLDGICFLKAHLLASLLRGLGIPAGFCYQRVLKTKDPKDGHALHGLNALYLPETGWFRVDPRGNKPGIHSEFSWEEERLAYPIRKALGEVDYPQIFTLPNKGVLSAMTASKTSQELFSNRPTSLESNQAPPSPSLPLT